jgi:hypothetical protein
MTQPPVTEERQALVSILADQRDHVLGILEGLSEEDLRRLDNLREILLHVIAETATHAGHLDAARELIDGRQWIVLTE